MHLIQPCTLRTLLGSTATLTTSHSVILRILSGGGGHGQTQLPAISERTD
jgi:hypothetical protein